MARKESKPRKDPFVRGAERLLATIKDMQDSIASESDPDRRRYTARLLRVALKKIAQCRKLFEVFSKHPDLGPGLREQIRIFLLIEDECRREPWRRRPN